MDPKRSSTSNTPTERTTDRPVEETGPSSTTSGVQTPVTPGEPSNAVRKEKGRVRFNSDADKKPLHLVPDPNALSKAIREASSSLSPERIRPSALRLNSYNSYYDLHGVAEEDEDGASEEKRSSALLAQDRAQQIAALVGSHSAPASRRNSIDDLTSTPGSVVDMQPSQLESIPLAHFATSQKKIGDAGEAHVEHKQNKPSSTSEAYKLVRSHTQYLNRHRDVHAQSASHSSGMVSGPVTPSEERDLEALIPPPEHYRGGVLSNLLKLYKPGDAGGHSRSGSESRGFMSNSTTPVSSGAATPTRRKWYDQKSQSQDTLAGLIEASAILGATAAGSRGSFIGSPAATPRPKRPQHKRQSSNRFMSMVGKPRLEDEIRITVHIAETLSRQKYIIMLCRALMLFGAPTHRLEEYMRMTARVLEIDGQFLYIPGCMLISFDDRSTHTTEVKIVRVNQGVDLGKLKDIHEIYKETLHDVIGVEEATQRLKTILDARPKHNIWLRVIVYGIASATVGPFAFGARLIDMPVAFLLGCILGTLQLVIAPMSDLYSNVFEVVAAVLTSFLARAFGSINGGELFCFSALAQSSIALILPGYLVLCSALELQSRNIVPGSIRMVYAIIYSLFLGFGITVGTAVYGLVDNNATSKTECSNTIPSHYNFLFVPAFALCLIVINQAKWKQAPVMVLIAMAGYTVNFFSSKKFPSSPQISNTLGAFVIGVLANLYSRLRHGVAAAALLPAIFVQVPSGLAATGSLLSGLSTANELTNSTQVVNGTSSVQYNQADDLNSIVFNVAFSMIQIAIGITVGLFLGALVVYPLGKRRSGLFSF